VLYPLSYGRTVSDYTPQKTGDGKREAGQDYSTGGAFA